MVLQSVLLRRWEVHVFMALHLLPDGSALKGVSRVRRILKDIRLCYAYGPCSCLGWGGSLQPMILEAVCILCRTVELLYQRVTENVRTLSVVAQ